ncbi:FUBP2 protein, partial [Dicrurus megarhynchus]|nr:FUBP2 protein [Dicrurus megarhynchus]
VTEEYRVPDGMVGLIIGRGGEQINKIQQDSGCKVQISPDSGGLPERSVSLTGSPESVQDPQTALGPPKSPPGSPPHPLSDLPSPPQTPWGPGALQERAGVKMILIQDGSQNTNVDKPLRIIGEPYKVQQACEMVLDILRERDQGGFGERSDYGARLGGGIDVPVPRHSVGVVIGRSGEMIKKIQNDAGVRIQFKQDDGTGPEKIAHIMGPPERCEHAARIINDLLQSLRVIWGGGLHFGEGALGWGDCQEDWGLPGALGGFWGAPSYRGGFWGAGGENVKAINQQTGAFVEISRQLPPNGDPNFKLFVIRGTPQQIDHAKQLIEEKIEGPLCPVGPGPGPGGPPGPAGPMGPFNPGPFNQGPPGAPPHPGGPPPHQYPPQGWGNTYPQWQPPAPHDPSEYCDPPGPGGGSRFVGGLPRVWGTPPGLTHWVLAGAGVPPKIPPRGGAGDIPPAPDCPHRVPAAAQVASGGGPGAPPGPQPDYSAAWAEYYRQQAA